MRGMPTGEYEIKVDYFRSQPVRPSVIQSVGQSVSETIIYFVIQSVSQSVVR